LNRIESEDLPPTKISYTAPTTTAGVPTNIPGMPQVQTQSVPATGALEAGHTPPQALNMPGTPTVTAMSVPPANTTPTGIAASPLPPASGAMSQALNAAVTNAGPLTADDLRLGFKGAEESLPTDQTGKLERLAAKLKNNPDLRVELRSFASAGSDMGSKARRLSLSRALMVRTALTQRGVDVDRIDVRALGAATDPSDADTVDVFLVR
jgi:outer membrane protein OmpA-like peptidoglycan-associated protein